MILAAAAGGAAVLALDVRQLVGAATPSDWQLALAAVFGTMVVVGYLRPLVIYIGNASQAEQLDEAYLVLLLLLVPRSVTIVTFGLATIAGQLIIRRSRFKTIFNAGQALVSAAAAATVYGLVAHRDAGFSYGGALGAVLAVIAFLVVNNAAYAALQATLGKAWRAVLFEGLMMRLVLSAGGVGVALSAALILAERRSGLPFAVLLLVVLRWALGGFFRARHDRARLEGLFKATLQANGSIGGDADQVIAGLLDSARTLLRCTRAELGQGAAERGDRSELRAPLEMHGETRWLTVSGRSRSEPFDSADQRLLEALAAVGSSALANAELYRQSHHERDRLATITSSLGEGVVAINRHGVVTLVNKAAASMLGWQPVTASGTGGLAGEDTAMPAPEFLWRTGVRAMATGETIATYDTRFWRADGSPIDVACTVAPTLEAGAPVGAVLVFRDISEHKRLAELTYHAFHDTLTGLPNRRQFLADLTAALQLAERSGGRHAVLFADIDRFKIVNDSLGHHAGDLLLIAITERMRSHLRPQDVLARFGGDEFTLLITEIEDVGEAVTVAERLLDALEEPIVLHDGHEIVASLSIGIALAEPGATGDDVLHDADVAMYQAKTAHHSGGYCVFDVVSMGARSAERIELEVELREAVEHGELEIRYQPQFSVPGLDVVSVEALVRWNHPLRGMLEPSHFIGVAEETGLILALGRIVLARACRTVREWERRFGTPLVVGVNLSARQFQHSGLLADIKSVISSSGVNPSQLCFEITESVAMQDAEETAKILSGIKSLGASVAIDDFGTGHSALGYLASFPIDVVKIDRSFIVGLEDDPVKSAIVSAVVTMAEAIGCATVAEGVETAQQLALVQSLGCSMAQGYYLSAAVTSAELEARVVDGYPRFPSQDRSAIASARGLRLQPAG